MATAFSLGIAHIIYSETQKREISISASYKWVFWFATASSCIGFLICLLLVWIPKASGDLIPKGRSHPDDTDKVAQGGPIPTCWTTMSSNIFLTLVNYVFASFEALAGTLTEMHKRVIATSWPFKRTISIHRWTGISFVISFLFTSVYKPFWVPTT